VGQTQIPRLFLLFTFSTFFIVYFSKIIICLFLGVEDIARLAITSFNFVKSKIFTDSLPHSPARSAALAKMAMGVAAVPLVSLIYGMVKGAYKYKIHNISLKLPNLPTGFEGLKIVQISDIHVGSFYDKEAVKKGVQMIMDQKPDLVFFTGDLVNNEAEEMRDYLDIFSAISAPLGIYSVLGNHDYGDYKNWPTAQAKQQNLQLLKDFQKQMGWRLLMDEHANVEVNGESIAVVGIQNWGAKGRFPKYGNLKKALEGASNFPVKLLLSHDPSHWDAQVLTEYPEIDVMFAGHTHGMQFGVEIPGIKWSPVQYLYQHWAGLYKHGGQQLYVNRGFGFIGYPGRVGIWPEISVFTLAKA
jgi:predicted MPP superfamily phosphohydrolase